MVDCKILLAKWNCIVSITFAFHRGYLPVYDNDDDEMNHRLVLLIEALVCSSLQRGHSNYCMRGVTGNDVLFHFVEITQVRWDLV